MANNDFDASYLTFSLGGRSFGIPAVLALEINRNLDYTIVPNSPKLIRGILNLRGQLIPAIDLRSILGSDEDHHQLESVGIIVDLGLTKASLLVDSVGDIIPLGGVTFELPPPNFPSQGRRAIIGAHKLVDSLLIILDPKLLVVDYQ